jgi:hypothetical protein
MRRARRRDKLVTPKGTAMPTDESGFLHDLQNEVEAELNEFRSSAPDEERAVSPTEWLVGPTDIEREEVGLTNLLGAVEALDGDS